MSPFAILALALSMSADAFAAALARGAATRPGWGAALKGGAVFGIVEALTPLGGWLIGRLAQGAVEQWDHWIAFALLCAVGLHMIRNGLRAEPDLDESLPTTGLVLLIVTAIGTSIDAAAVGIGLALIDVNILLVAVAIGLSTFICTTIGLRLGGNAGQFLGRRVELVAGIVLIGIGLLIVADHTGYLSA